VFLQAAAQAVAAQAATGELAASLKAAEARNTALLESLSELQEALERQRAAADLREEMLRQVHGQVLVLDVSFSFALHVLCPF
jgi:hypothetical protein